MQGTRQNADAKRAHDGDTHDEEGHHYSTLLEGEIPKLSLYFYLRVISGHIPPNSVVS